MNSTLAVHTAHVKAPPPWPPRSRFPGYIREMNSLIYKCELKQMWEACGSPGLSRALKHVYAALCSHRARLTDQSQQMHSIRCPSQWQMQLLPWARWLFFLVINTIFFNYVGSLSCTNEKPRKVGSWGQFCVCFLLPSKSLSPGDSKPKGVIYIYIYICIVWL